MRKSRFSEADRVGAEAGRIWSGGDGGRARSRSGCSSSGGWGSSPQAFEPELRDEYVRALRRPENVHAICEEYRAAASIDVQHDTEDRRAGRRITSPLLALWSAHGPLDSWYADAGGPVGVWRTWATHVQGYAVGAGHFFPEEVPGEIAAALGGFFAGEADERPASLDQLA